LSHYTDSELKEKINNCYLRALKGQSDQSGLNYYFNRIKNGKLSLDDLPKALIQANKIRQSQLTQEIQNISSKTKKPIFIFGVPRSGTTYLYYRLCFHPDLAWTSHLDVESWTSKNEQKKMKENIAEKKKNNQIIPANESALFVLGTDFQPPLKGTSKIPIEANTLWMRYLDDYSKDVRIENKKQLIKIISKILKNQKKHRFLNKAPQNSLRLFSLQKCFPDAKFIHLIRDPKAVVSSMLRIVNVQGQFITGIIIKNESEYEKLDNIQKWAWLYKEIIEAINEFAIQQNKDNFLRVKYEDLIAQPYKKFREIMKFCELNPSKAVMESIPPARPNQLTKWKDTLSSDDAKKIMEIVSPCLKNINANYES